MQVIYNIIQLLFTMVFLYIVVRGIITAYNDAEGFINRRNRW